MALDQAYFDAISIDVVKKKYYNANKVEALLSDIRQQALQLNRENELLNSQLLALNGQKSEIGDTLLSAKAIAQQIIQDAQRQADQILADALQRSRELTDEAEQRSRELADEAEQRRQALPRQMEETERHLRSRILRCLDEISDELRALSDAAVPESTTPPDLSEKVDAIAREMLSFGEEQD